MDRSILFCVATEKGYAVLRAVHDACEDVRIHISTFEETKVVETYYENICDFAEKKDLLMHEWETIKNGGPKWIKENNIWAIVCVGWRFLLPEELVAAVNGRVIVTHDSLLPKYRGFAPLPSALLNEEEEVGITVLFAAPEVDAGDILYQKKIQVSETDTIKSLITRLLPYFCEGVLFSLRGLLAGTLTATPQDRSKATFSIWRDEEDLWINWHDSAKNIARFVRALGPPYLGAKISLKNSVITITDAHVVPNIHFEIRQPGKVWCLTKSGEPVVVCGNGMLVIKEAFCSGTSIIPFKQLRVRFRGYSP